MTDMQWEDLDKGTLDVMEELGGFGPTVNPQHRIIKGVMYSQYQNDVVKTYYNSEDLRVLAKHLLEVAAWLDKRADES